MLRRERPPSFPGSPGRVQMCTDAGIRNRKQHVSARLQRLAAKLLSGGGHSRTLLQVFGCGAITEKCHLLNVVGSWDVQLLNTCHPSLD